MSFPSYFILLIMQQPQSVALCSKYLEPAKPFPPCQFMSSWSAFFTQKEGNQEGGTQEI